MRLLDQLERLEMEPDWCLLALALEWSAWESFVAPSEVQGLAAELLDGDELGDEGLLLELASLSPDDHSETLRLVSRLAELTGCSMERARRTLTAVVAADLVERWDSAHPTTMLVRTLDLWALADWPEDGPSLVASWRDDLGDPSSIASVEGSVRLRDELQAWVRDVLKGM